MSLLALIISFIVFIRSFPSRSKIDLRPGNRVLLYTNASAEEETGDKGQIGAIRVRIPLAIINSGGKPEIIDQILLSMQNLDDTADHVPLAWHAFQKSDNGNFEGYPTPVLVNPESYIGKLIVFASPSDTRSWRPRVATYAFQLTARLAYQSVSLPAQRFIFHFTHADSLAFEANKTEMTQTSIVIHPNE